MCQQEMLTSFFPDFCSGEFYQTWVDKPIYNIISIEKYLEIILEVAENSLKKSGKMVLKSQGNWFGQPSRHPAQAT